jgi:hypothetical protein
MSDDTTLPPPRWSRGTPRILLRIGIGRSWTSRHTEKAPLPGLEAEYDERDLERWRASMLAAGSTSSSPRPGSIARSAVEPELDMQPPPPPPNRVRGVHIATDDKAELARLHSLADQPELRFLLLRPSYIWCAHCTRLWCGGRLVHGNAAGAGLLARPAFLTYIACTGSQPTHSPATARALPALTTQPTL